MTKQLKDLFQQFSTMETSAQLEAVREIRHHRSIERPAAAVKRIKKEKKQGEKKKTNLVALLAKLPPDQRSALMSRLKAELDEKKATNSSGVRETDGPPAGSGDSGSSGAGNGPDGGSPSSGSDSSANS